jgi:prephenate dehydrogenase
MKKTVSVYGYGRFGKLWADILAEDFNVKVYSRRGLKKEDVNPKVKIATLEELFNCDAMFFCVAISSFEEVLKESQKYFKKDTIYFDTCSVKLFPVKWMKKYILSDSQIIATHPMFGPDSYNSPKKLPLVMCNITAKAEVFDFWKKYFSERRMRIEEMTPDEHDKVVAYSQGITHYVGRVLSDINLQPTKISTVGYSKLLEIIQQTCNDNWQLFLDLQRFNPYTKNMRQDLHKSIQKIYSILNEIESNGK